MDTIEEGFIAWVFVGLAVALAVTFLARAKEEGPMLYVVAVVGALTGAAVVAPLLGFGMLSFLGYDPFRPGLNVGTVLAAAVGAVILQWYVRRVARRR